MSFLFAGSVRHGLWCLVLTVVMLGAPGFVRGQTADPGAAAALRAKYTELQERLRNNQFQRPLHLESAQTGNTVRGEIYAQVDYPFATVAVALNDPAHWCDILILHLNTKYCRPVSSGSGTVLGVQFGRKFEESLDESKRVRFMYRVAAQAADYFQILLNADTGQFGTTNYRISLEGVPLSADKSFLHLSYSYEYGIAAKLAIQTYLSTLGSSKVGFTVVGKQDNGQPLYVGDMRGAQERNTVRYYLAIDAFLKALTSPPEEQPEKRIREWFASTERYPLQLHELEEKDYVEMKRREVRRQQEKP